MPLPRRTLTLLAVLASLCVVGGGAVALLERAAPSGFSAPDPRKRPEPTGELRGATDVRLVPVARGYEQPTDVAFTPTDPPRLIVLEKTGKARIATFRRDAAEKHPVEGARTWFEVAVNQASEMGLLGIALHPRFAENGRFFVHHDPAGPKLRSRITEWHVDPARLDDARPELVRTLLELDQPFANHKGGQLAFGPDGMLYIGFGDGGSGGDPHGNGQNLGTWLGKILRIDVEHADDAHPYAAPPDGPLVGREGARPEIWAWGLRNPWRFSFDPAGRLVVADVGQDLWEEVDLVTRGGNYGWNVREGRHCYQREACDAAGLVDPVWEYGHDVGSSITGGYAYLGSRAPSLRGRWLVGDFGSGRLWSLALPEKADAGGAEAVAASLGRADINPSTFGRAPDGEVYVADFGSGTLFGLAARAP